METGPPSCFPQVFTFAEGHVAIRAASGNKELDSRFAGALQAASPNVCLPVSFLATLPAILAIIFGTIGRKQSLQTGKGRGMATIGLVTGISALVLSIVIPIIQLISLISATVQGINATVEGINSGIQGANEIIEGSKGLLDALGSLFE